MKRKETMKKTEIKIRREVKYSPDEWNKVTELAKESGKLPAAYIREQALDPKIKIIDHSAYDKNGVSSKTDTVQFCINRVAKDVNTNKEVFAKDVEEVERWLNYLGDIAKNGLTPIPMIEVKL